MPGDSSVTKNTNRMKCRWCDYTVMKFRKTKSGETSSGWGKLQAHCWDSHIDEMDDTIMGILSQSQSKHDMTIPYHNGVQISEFLL